jgi:peptidoglycan/LPS O-acetylase OafA/YrhL
MDFNDARAIYRERIFLMEPAQEKGKLQGIELSRGIAAVMVAIYHISRHYEKNFGDLPFGAITKFGHAGVDFFFTLSGFIILYIHLNDCGKPLKLKGYLVKRIARVYPFYWFMLLVAVCVVVVNSKLGLPSLSLLLKNIILWPLGMNDLLIGVSWTLQHEILFYLIFSILIINIRIGLITLILWLITIIYASFFNSEMNTALVLLSAFNIQFFIGMFTAFLLKKFNIKYGVILLWTGICAFSLIAGMEINGLIDGYSNIARLYYGIASMFVILGLVSYERENILKLGLLCESIGRSSYAIYLTHLIVSGILFKIFSYLGVINVLPYWGSAALLIATTVYIACWISKTIEIPLSKLMRKALLRQ